MLLQWLVTERSHKEDLADSSATNVPQVHDTAVVSGDFEMFTLDKCGSKHLKWLESTQPDARGSGRPGQSIAFTETEPPLSIAWHLSSCTQSVVPMSAEVSEKWLAFASDVCDPSRSQSQVHAASRRAVYSCR